MMNKAKTSRYLLLAMFLPGSALAEFEIGDSGITVEGYLQNRTSVFTKSGQINNGRDSMLDNSDNHSGGDLMMFENSARFFLNGDIGENSSWHADLNFIYDTEAEPNDWQGYWQFSQYDYLRELYLDTSIKEWDLRLGKQQVVWGTADGIKLLDIVNPTDYRHWVQDSLEDSRIPVWMINAERNVGENGNVQFIVSQVSENIIPGLRKSGDQNQPFVMKGVETLTGEVNGFLNISPALGGVAQSFNLAAMGGAFTGGVPNPTGLVPFTGLTVDGFASAPVDVSSAPGQILLPGSPGYNPATTIPGYIALNNITQNGLAPGDPNGNNNVTNLMDVTGPTAPEVNWKVSNATAAFEYMPSATFSTFNTFANATSLYTRDYPNNVKANFGTRYRGNTDGGLNFSFNYFYHYDSNPSVKPSWHDSKTGEKLQVQRVTATAMGMPDTSTSLSEDQIPNNVAMDGSNTVTMLLKNSKGQYYGPVNPTSGMANTNTNLPQLRMTEELNRIHSIGTSFDYAWDTKYLPVIIRGEFLYNRNQMQPVLDKRLLAIGDLSNAFKTEEVDMFNYVIGVDVTVLRNLLASFQFIQYRNLDYVNKQRTCTSQAGNKYDCSAYTGYAPTLSLSNGMKKGYENQEFYSFFLSKPFGPSDEHRVNNITMYEEGGGYWNRFDVEYTFMDNLLGTVAWNNYWGDDDSMFGQFRTSSNLQLGIKFLF